MRSGKLGLLFLALYLTFLGGSAYYALIFPVRVLHHALVTLLLAAWLVVRLRQRQGLPRTPLNPPLYALTAVWFFSALLSADSRMAFEGVWFQVTHLLFFFGLVDLFQQGRQREVMEIQFFMAAAVVLVSGLELASWYFGLGLTPGTEVGWIDVFGPGAWLPLKAPRLSLAMNISTLLAGYLAPLVTLTVGWALTASRRDFRRALWGLALAIAVILVLTFSRGGWISAAVGLTTFGALRFWRTSPRFARLSLRAVAVLAIVVVVAAALAFVILSIGGRSSGDRERVDMWQSAIVLARDHPLGGVGPGQFGSAYRLIRDQSTLQDKLISAHNIVLNHAAETGLPGIAVAVWLAVVFLRVWWRNRQSAEEETRKLRLEAAFGALVGAGFHSLVDVFTITPIVLVLALLAAYCVVGHRRRLQKPIPPDRPWTGVVALVIVLAYGLWFIPMDAAQALFHRSQRGGENALADIHFARLLDPALNLYPLQQAYLIGLQADAGAVPLADAVAAYQDALRLEPTWDAGWLNLAAFYERQGEIALALDALDRAARITPWNSGLLHWARLAEAHAAADDDAIVAAYYRAMFRLDQTLPLSSFWRATPLRRAALDRYLAAAASPEVAYRVATAHDLETARDLVPDTPRTAADWWVLGQSSLQQGDAVQAAGHFSEAIHLMPRAGDYYLARARALAASDPQAARRDLRLGLLLGPLYESPALVRLALASTADAERARLAALPPRILSGEFAAVRFGRSATFDLLPEVRPLGPGLPVLQPVFDQAALYREAGRLEDAAALYRAILAVAPEETLAQQHLDALTALASTPPALDRSAS